MATVVNRYKEEFDVYIGRGSIWGNPFTHKEGTKAQIVVSSREAAVKAYRGWLWNQLRVGNITKEMLIELDGKRLGCYCKPQACHGDVIVMAIKWAKGEL